LLESLIVVSTLLGIAGVVIVLGSRGRGPQVFLSLKALEDVAHGFSVARYTGAWQEPATARALVTFDYLGALLAGILLATRRSGWTRWLVVAPFIPSAMMAAVLTTKASLALPIGLAASSYLAAHLAVRRSLPRLDAKRVAWLASLSVVLFGVFVLVQMARYSYTSLVQVGIVLGIFRLELFAYMAVFANWLQQSGWATTKPAWGFYTFAGPFDLLHLGHRVPGLYTDQADIGGSPYNIYTAFRGLIEDFTLPGALAVLGLIGYGAQFAFSQVRRGDIRFVASLAAFYAFTLWSLFADVFSNNTVLAAYALLTAYLLLAPLLGVRHTAAILDRLRLRRRDSHSSSKSAES
jgi:oligosaccharide repeat unit polymerase